jgi:hypothetical protein
MKQSHTAKTHFEMIPVEDVMKRVAGAALDDMDNAPPDSPVGGPKSRKRESPRVSPQSGNRSDEKRR